MSIWPSISTRFQFRQKPSHQANYVELDQRSLLEVRKWKQTGNVFSGYFVTKHGAWSGNVHFRGDKYLVLIKNPPARELKLHHKWICFHKQQKRGWYEINLRISPRDNGDIVSEVSSLIAYTERLIIESYRLAGKH